MSSIDLAAMLESGMHFGHLTRRWNPKMKPFIYGVRNGIHIIDLSKTARQLKSALNFLRNAVGEGKDVLFVGTKRQAQDLIQEAAENSKMHYVNRRWLGGTLTNWRTIKASISRLKGLQEKKESGIFEELRKKENLMIDREIDKLLHSLGGIQNMGKVPGVMVIVDPHLEHIALKEAKNLNIPVVALADTNCNPELIDYPVVGNDDALKSLTLFLKMVTEAILEGNKLREENARKAAEVKQAKREEAAKGPIREIEIKKSKEPRGRKKATAKKGAYVGGSKEGEVASQQESSEGEYSAKVEKAPKEEAAQQAAVSEETPQETSAEKAAAPEVEETKKPESE